MKKEKKYKIQVIGKDGKPIKSILDKKGLTDKEKTELLKKQEKQIFLKFSQEHEKQREKYPELFQLLDKYPKKNAFQLFGLLVGIYCTKVFVNSLLKTEEYLENLSYNEQVLYIENNIKNVELYKFYRKYLHNIDVAENKIVQIFNEWLDIHSKYLKNIYITTDTTTSNKQTKIKEKEQPKNDIITKAETELKKLYLNEFEKHLSVNPLAKEIDFINMKIEWFEKAAQRAKEQYNISGWKNEIVLNAYYNFMADIELLKKRKEELEPSKDTSGKIEFNNENLKDIFFPNYINDFIDIEKGLVKERYFDITGKWIKYKNDLVALIMILWNYGYFKKINNKGGHLKETDCRKLFEKRYNIEIAYQFKPSQRNKLNLTGYYHWIQSVVKK